MAKVKNTFGEKRYVPWLGVEVESGKVVDVPDEDLASYLEGGWAPADKPTTVRHKELLAEGTVTVGAAKEEKES